MDRTARGKPQLETTSEHGGDWIIPQDWHLYTSTEHAIWDRLFERQVAMLGNRAAPEFLAGVDILRLDRKGIPDFDDLSDRLERQTGWRIVAVPGLVPDRVFFEHLANRRFVAGRFIRRADQFDYLQEPDVFHDVFGHVPLLADPVFADFMQAYGQGGLRADGLGALERLARLYWYTVEFGLVQTGQGLKLFGAGIASSHGESHFALDDPSPHRIAFDLERVMRTQYRIDSFQQTYFVIESFDELLRKTFETDFRPVYAALAQLPDIEPHQLIDGDVAIGMEAGATLAH